jgi:rod shape-determining protein MreD
MKFVITVALALSLLTLESVTVKYLGFSVTRIDLTVAMIAFLALRASLMEGAFSAFAIGYLLDLMSGRPTGLYTFLGVLMFLLGRFSNSFFDVRSAPSFALFAAAVDAGHALLASFFSWMTTRQSGPVGFSLGGFAVQVLLTGAGAFALYPVLRKVDPASERPEIGALR